jgi:hypothetical protein
MNVCRFRSITVVVMGLLLGFTMNPVLASGYSSGSNTTASLITNLTIQPVYRQQNPVVNAVLFWSRVVVNY